MSGSEKPLLVRPQRLMLVFFGAKMLLAMLVILVANARFSARLQH